MREGNDIMFTRRFEKVRRQIFGTTGLEGDKGGAVKEPVSVKL